jgi:hypothetical protein
MAATNVDNFKLAIVVIIDWIVVLVDIMWWRLLGRVDVFLLIWKIKYGNSSNKKVV